MKKPVLLLATKCAFIGYFAACTGINAYACTLSATPQVAPEACKINFFIDLQNNETAVLGGCSFVFDSNAKIVINKKGKQITGNWDHGETSKKININLDANEPALAKLSNNRPVSNISHTGVSFNNAANPFKVATAYQPLIIKNVVFEYLSLHELIKLLLREQLLSFIKSQYIHKNRMSKYPLKHDINPFVFAKSRVFCNRQKPDDSPFFPIFGKIANNFHRNFTYKTAFFDNFSTNGFVI